VQALTVFAEKGSFFGTQYHPEYNLFEMGRLIAARAQPLVNEGFFKSEAAVAAVAENMKKLHLNPKDSHLKKELGVGDDILDPRIKEQEFKNWIHYLQQQSNPER
jgi:GMP synthase (glutamine-hydrolysing)